MEQPKRANDCFDMLERLSKEMRGEIFHWLAEDIYTIRELGKIATVCKTWSVYVSDNFLWRQLYQHEWPWEDLSEVEVRRVSCAFNWKKMYLHRRQAEIVKPPGAHVNMDAAVTLHELYKGITKRFAQKDLKSLCAKCGGWGAKKPSLATKCEVCVGSGVVLKQHQVGQGMVQQTQTICYKCEGSGRMVEREHQCPGCTGKGFIFKRSVLKVDIPAGMQWGDQILLDGRGEQGSNKEQPGDVILTLTEKKVDDLTVTRHQTDHLLLEKEISFSDSLFGFSFLYTQLDGRKIVIQSKPGVITTTGMILAITGEGMPIPGGHERGDLLVKFKVQDAKLTTEQILMLQDLRPQLERILGSPSFYQPHDYDEIVAKEGKYKSSTSSGSEEGRKPKKVQARRRPKGQRPNAQPNNQNPQDPNNLFNQFFGGGGQANPQQQYQNDNVEDENMDVDGNEGAGQTQCQQQ
eukprot:TRINITY_DN9392_c0_g1_i1.p1 TRINITY_DN9392_c0_g1~~TRINITY_DN9392_c0_g1_i1.p1  ORF type:complete len:462 (-),score=45.03 TRINITY_DN9392_c0_g1_i1:176-1561(-)